MARRTMERADRVILSRAKNRPSLATCPADIISAVFFADERTCKKAMRLCLRSRADRAITALSFHAVYLDRADHPISEANLTFNGIYLAPHKTSMSSKKVILPYQDIAGIHAYITSITYDDGEVHTFNVDDYTLTPEQQLFEHTLSEADCRLLRRSLGDMCRFVPQLRDDGIWYCACGAVAEGDLCSACGMKRNAAIRLADEGRTQAWLRVRRVELLALRCAPYLAALVLFVGGVWAIRNVAVENITVRLPAQRLETTRKFIVENRYEEALAYSVSKNGALLYDEILDAAVAYYCESGDFARAAEFEQCRETPAYEPIYESAARAFIAGDSGESTAAYALSVSDDALYNGVLRRLSEDKLAAGHREDACTYALAMRGEEGAAFADALLYDTIEALLSDARYEDAVRCIACLNDTSRVAEVCRGIEQELLKRGRYEDAFTVAGITGDDSVFALAYPTAGATTVRQYYDKFYPFMSAAEKREFLATPLSARGSFAIVQTNGVVLDSERGVLADAALSVACGRSHVLVLQKDGTVRAYGDNSMGQCNCDGLSGAIAVAAGDYHSLILMEDGTVRAYGDNSDGQCDVETLTGVIYLAAGARHSVAITESARVVATGSNQSGQCNVSSFENVVSLCCGDYSTVLVFRDGTVSVVGNIAIETFDCREWEDVARVAAGNGHLIALTSGGRVLYAGSPGYDGTEEAGQWSRVKYIACGSESIYTMDAFGKILYCGSDVPQLSGSEWEAHLS